METEGAPALANGRIHRGLRSKPSFEGEGEGGYGLAVDVEEREVLPQSSSRICAW